mmetsp:Transcript_15516/g.22761  ORF Transcript_15516/g.22761 Transcript_15516/m.22761 type:complete len:102 (+) Transcript_15516:902-1207(+)
MKKDATPTDCGSSSSRPLAAFTRSRHRLLESSAANRAILLLMESIQACATRPLFQFSARECRTWNRKELIKSEEDELVAGEKDKEMECKVLAKPEKGSFSV